MSAKSQNIPTQPLINALLASYREYASQLSGRRVWLACSGGRDSLSLAALCQQLYLDGQLPFLPQLLHVNHGLQAANIDWAQQVKAWATAHDMPCQVLSVEIAGRDEQAARNARYTAMMQVMNNGNVLILGHHGDDQAETVLMRLLNGAGVHGLGGMRAWTQKYSQGSEPAQQSIYLWRPWLSVSREQITTYANSTELDYVDDPTNVIDSINLSANGHNQTHHDDDNQSHANFAEFNDRAWLRSVIMPQLQARFPQANTAIMRSSQLLQEASTIVTVQAEQDIENCLYQATLKPQQLASSQDISQWHAILNIELLLTLPYARQAAAIHQWLSPARDDLPPPKRLVDEVRELYTRSDPDHQTCLTWYSKGKTQQNSDANAQPYYEIRRYQQQLLRLHSDWVAWLAAPPLTQSWLLIVAKDQLPHSCSLKSATLSAIPKAQWQLNHLTELAKALAGAIEKDKTAQGSIALQPLPRDLKVTLAGREGRKSGKKLLQALTVPAFMRESVVLGTLKIEVNNSAVEMSCEAEIPLFILTLDGVAVLASPHAPIVQNWLQHHYPVMQLRHN